MTTETHFTESGSSPPRRSRGRPTKERRCQIKGCTALAVTGIKVCHACRDARNARWATREARKVEKARRKSRPLSYSRRAQIARMQRADDNGIYGTPGRARFYIEMVPAKGRPRVLLPPGPPPSTGEVISMPPPPPRRPISRGMRYLAQRLGFTSARGSSRPARPAYVSGGRGT